MPMEKCGEGKTWFQKYVQSLLGQRRVVAGGINIHCNSPSNISKLRSLKLEWCSVTKISPMEWFVPQREIR